MRKARSHITRELELAEWNKWGDIDDSESEEEPEPEPEPEPELEPAPIKSPRKTKMPPPPVVEVRRLLKRVVFVELKRQILDGDLVEEEKRKREWEEEEKKRKQEQELQKRAKAIAAGAAAAAALAAAAAEKGGRFWALPSCSAIAHVTGTPEDASFSNETSKSGGRSDSGSRGVQESERISDTTSAPAGLSRAQIPVDATNKQERGEGQVVDSDDAQMRYGRMKDSLTGKPIPRHAPSCRPVVARITGMSGKITTGSGVNFSIPPKGANRVTPRPLGKAVSTAVGRYLKALLINGAPDGPAGGQDEAAVQVESKVVPDNMPTELIVTAAAPPRHVEVVIDRVKSDVDAPSIRSDTQTADLELSAMLAQEGQEDGSMQEIEKDIQVPGAMTIEMTKTLHQPVPKPGHIHFIPPSLNEGSSVSGKQSGTGCSGISQTRRKEAKVTESLSHNKMKYTQGVNKGLLLMPGYNINRYEKPQESPASATIIHTVDGPGGKTVTVKALMGEENDNNVDKIAGMQGRISAVNAVHADMPLKPSSPEPSPPVPPVMAAALISTENSIMTRSLQRPSSAGNAIVGSVDHYYDSLQTRPKIREDHVDDDTSNRANEGVLDGMSDPGLNGSVTSAGEAHEMLQIASWDASCGSREPELGTKSEGSRFMPVQRGSDIVEDVNEGTLEGGKISASSLDYLQSGEEEPSLANMIVSDILNGTAATLLGELDSLLLEQAREEQPEAPVGAKRNEVTEYDDDKYGPEEEEGDGYEDFHAGSMSIGIASPDRRLGRDALLLLYGDTDDYDGGQYGYDTREESKEETEQSQMNASNLSDGIEAEAEEVVSLISQDYSQEFESAGASEVADDEAEEGETLNDENEEEPLFTQVALVVHDLRCAVEEGATMGENDDHTGLTQVSLPSVQSLHVKEQTTHKESKKMTFAEYAAHLEEQRGKPKHPPVRTVGKRLYGSNIVEIARAKRKRDREEESRVRLQRSSPTNSPHIEPSNLAAQAPRTYSSLLVALAGVDSGTTETKSAVVPRAIAPVGVNGASYQRHQPQRLLREHKNNSNNDKNTSTVTSHEVAAVGVVSPPIIEVHGRKSPVDTGSPSKEDKTTKSPTVSPVVAIPTLQPQITHQSSSNDSVESSIAKLTGDNHSSPPPTATATGETGASMVSDVLPEVESAATALLLSMLGPVTVTTQEQHGGQAVVAMQEDVSVEHLSPASPAQEGIARAVEEAHHELYREQVDLKAIQHELVSNLHDPSAWGKLAAELAVKEGELIRNRLLQDQAFINSATAAAAMPSHDVHAQRSASNSMSVTPHGRTDSSSPSRPNTGARVKRGSPLPAPSVQVPPVSVPGPMLDSPPCSPLSRHRQHTYDGQAPTSISAPGSRLHDGDSDASRTGLGLSSDQIRVQPRHFPRLTSSGTEYDRQRAVEWSRKRQQLSNKPYKAYVRGDHEEIEGHEQEGEGGKMDAQAAVADQQRMVQLLEQALLRRTPLNLLQEERALVAEGGEEEDSKVAADCRATPGTMSAALSALREARKGLLQAPSNPVLHPPAPTSSHIARDTPTTTALLLQSQPPPITMTHDTATRSTAVALQYAQGLAGHGGSKGKRRKKEKNHHPININKSAATLGDMSLDGDKGGSVDDDKEEGDEGDEDEEEFDLQIQPDLIEGSASHLSFGGVEKVELRRKSFDGHSHSQVELGGESNEISAVLHDHEVDNDREKDGRRERERSSLSGGGSPPVTPLAHFTSIGHVEDDKTLGASLSKAIELSVLQHGLETRQAKEQGQLESNLSSLSMKTRGQRVVVHGGLGKSYDKGLVRLLQGQTNDDDEEEEGQGEEKEEKDAGSLSPGNQQKTLVLGEETGAPLPGGGGGGGHAAALLEEREIEAELQREHLDHLLYQRREELEREKEQREKRRNFPRSRTRMNKLSKKDREKEQKEAAASAHTGEGGGGGEGGEGGGGGQATGFCNFSMGRNSILG